MSNRPGLLDHLGGVSRSIAQSDSPSSNTRSIAANTRESDKTEFHHTTIPIEFADMTSPNTAERNLFTSIVAITIPILLSISATANGKIVDHQSPPPTTYTYDVIQQYVPRRMPETFIAATLSGGGMRAAALSYGALTALHDTTIDPLAGNESSPQQDRPNLLSEVDFVSAVSGSSVAASYWALHGSSEKFKDFETDFLKKEIQSKILTRVINPTSILQYLVTPFTRSDALVDFFDKELLGGDGKTYRDLLDLTIEHRDRPYLVINATDMDTRSLFPFVQLQFGLICRNLNEEKVAKAVAASAAYPLLFPAIALENRRLSPSLCPRSYAESSFVDGTSEGGGTDDESNEVLTKTQKRVKDQRVHIKGKKDRLSEQLNDLEQAGQDANDVREAISVATGEVAITAEKLKQARSGEATLRRQYDVAKGIEHALHKEIVERERKVTVTLEKFYGRQLEANIRRLKLDEEWRRIASVSDAANERWTSEFLDSPIEAIKEAGNEFRRWLTDEPDSMPDSFEPIVAGTFPGAEECVLAVASKREVSHETASGASPSGARAMKANANVPREALSDVIRDLGSWTERQDLSDLASEDEQPAAPTEPPPVSELRIRASRAVSDIEGLKSEQRDANGGIRRTLEELTRVRHSIDLNEQETKHLNDGVAFVDGLLARGETIEEETGNLEGAIRTLESDLSMLPESDAEPMDGAESGSDHTGDVAALVAQELRRIEQAIVVIAERRMTMEDMHSDASKYAEALGAMQMRLTLQVDAAAVEAELAGVDTELEYWDRCIAAFRASSSSELEKLKVELRGKEEASEKARVSLETEGLEVKRLETLDDVRRETLEARNDELSVALSVERNRKKELQRQRESIDEEEGLLEDLKDLEKRQKTKVELARILERERSKAIRKFEEQMPHYNDKDTKYVHLIDGGVADNIGFTPLIELLDSFIPSRELMLDESRKWRARVNEVAVIVVDARGSTQRRFSKEDSPPGLYETMMTTVNTAIEGKSRLLADELERITRGLERELVVSKSFLVPVDFEEIENFAPGGELSACRRAYERIPTNWSLKPVVVDSLVGMGRALVLGSSEYRKMVDYLRVQLPSDTGGVRSICKRFEGELAAIYPEEEPKKDNGGNGSDRASEGGP